MPKTEPWFVRLTLHGFDKASALMKDFGYRGRDVLAEDAMSVLAAVKSGAKLPDCIDAARRRYQQIIIERNAKEAANAPADSSKQAGQRSSPGQPSPRQTGRGTGNTDDYPDDRR